MDYKVKYKEAFERVKKLLETCGSNRWCEYISTEHKESRDERIRKDLIKQLAYFSAYCII